jgi:hypothetical protein
MVADKKLSPEEEIADALEQDLRELESYIQDFWHFLPLPICYINPVHNILDVDDCLVNFSDYKSTEIVGEDIKILFKDDVEIEDFKKRILKEESLSAIARKSEEGEVIGYFLSIVDLTETVNFQAKLQEEVDKKTKELQEKIEELEAFHKIAVGRELKMIELKEKITQFKNNNSLEK